MEIRANYLMVGTVVLALIAGLAAFSLWLVKADVDRQIMAYEIYFEGSVTGLQEGSQVRYRGIPVGQVVEIGIDPDNVERVRTLAEIDHATPITKDTIATLEVQGITGIAYVQLLGGTSDSAPLTIEDDKTYPVIAARRSTLERVFESTPDLLAQAVTIADQFSLILSDDNVETLSTTLGNIERLTGGLADSSGEIGTVMANVNETLEQVQGMAADLRVVSGKLGVRIDGLGGNLHSTLTGLGNAADALGGAARQLDVMVGDLREPLSDFSGTGLYELTHLVGESRALVAALNRITKEVERDPAGFLIGSHRRGFEAE
ncbi:MAG: MlaD family protein [Geminicoccaceae bacterium]